ncbi:MAG: shikimate kinase [Acidobacteriota bacterium]
MKKQPPSAKKIIFLVGFMGSGKSTIGPILANTIGYNFIDLDIAIELREAKKINEIFSEKGEPYFRSIERQLLEEIAASASKTIISLGGGTLASEETLQYVKSTGIVVYLKVNEDQIYKRLHAKGDRPMLRDESGTLLNGEPLMAKIRALLDRRTPFYERADIIMHTDDKKIGMTIDELTKQLRGLIEN